MLMRLTVVTISQLNMWQNIVLCTRSSYVTRRLYLNKKIQSNHKKDAVR